MLKNVKILHKMILSFGVIAVLSTLIIIFSTVSIRIVAKGTQTLYNEPYKANDLMWTVRRNMVSIERGFYKGIAVESETENQSMVNSINESANGALSALNELKNIYTEGENLELLNQIFAIAAEAGPVRQEIIDDILAGNDNEALNLIKNEYSPLFEQITVPIMKLSEIASNEAKHFIQNAGQTEGIAIAVNILLLIVSLILCLGIATLITKDIMVPIYKIRDAVYEVSKGNLNVRIDYHYKNALGELAEDFMKTISELKKYIDAETHILGELANKNFDIDLKEEFIGDFKSLKDSTITIIKSFNEMMAQIKDTSTQVNQASNQIATSAESLATGSAEQASSIENLVNTINGITEEVIENAKSSDNVNELTSNVVENLEDGNKYMSDLLNSMQKINAQSQEISNIIKIINDIAKQTNLLSLNASIEAARAGENGKGFAVVANEIGKLASECGDAVKNTSELINANLVVVDEGSKLTDETAKCLNVIVSSAMQTKEFTDKISEACNRQADSLKGVLDIMNQVSLVVETNSAASEESSAASEELFLQTDTVVNLLNQYKLKAQ